MYVAGDHTASPLIQDEIIPYFVPKNQQEVINSYQHRKKVWDKVTTFFVLYK
jgi:hypothetical protein